MLVSVNVAMFKNQSWTTRRLWWKSEFQTSRRQLIQNERRNHFWFHLGHVRMLRSLKMTPGQKFSPHLVHFDNRNQIKCSLIVFKIIYSNIINIWGLSLISFERILTGLMTGVSWLTCWRSWGFDNLLPPSPVEVGPDMTTPGEPRDSRENNFDSRWDWELWTSTVADESSWKWVFCVWTNRQSDIDEDEEQLPVCTSSSSLILPSAKILSLVYELTVAT